MRNDILLNTLTSVDNVEIVKCGGYVLEVFDGFSVKTKNTILKQKLLLICLKKDLSKSQGKNLLQNLSKKIGLSVYGGSIRNDKNEEHKCVTETQLRENFDDRVKEWFLLKNDKLIVKLEADKGVDD